MPLPPRLSPAGLVWLFGLTQILGYGTLYYSFAILAGSVARDFGWSNAAVFGSFSLALLIGGMVAPMVGRRIDRHGAGPVMAIGSAAAAAALAATAFAPGPYGFAIGLIAVEIAATAVLYDAAFAAIVQTSGESARPRIVHLTLIAGFASTLFWPFTTWLHGFFDWREVLLVFAAVNLGLCMPLHLWVAASGRAARDAAPAPAPATAAARPPPQETLTGAEARRAFLLVTGGFALSGFVLSALLAQMVPVLTGLGLGSAALLVSALFGPAQVAVRFVNMIFGIGRHPIAVTLFAMAMLPLAVVVLALTAPSVAGAAVAAILLGFGSGLKSIVQGTLPLALFGSVAYGARLGRMAMARQFLAAAAPFAMALVVEAAGAATALLVFSLVGLAGVAAFWEVSRMLRARPAARNVAATD